MEIAKILRASYRRARQSDLAFYVNGVLLRTSQDPIYAPLQPLLADLQQRQNTYVDASSDSLSLDRAKILAKKLAQQALIRQLSVVAEAVEQLAAGDPQIIANAGFTLASGAPRRKSGDLLKPVIRQARGTGELGEILVILSGNDGPKVLVHALEYSADQGQHWVNGFYHNFLTFRVPDLPPTRDLLIRVRAIGQRGIKSVWSEPLRVAVA